MRDNNGKLYFPNLDGLRFFMAMFVIAIHVEDLKITHGKEIIPFMRFYATGGLGNLDVSAFFVLSGFLITYILFKEQQATGTINMKNYYTRRTLRIWPLYFFIILMGFFVLPHLDSFFHIAYSQVIYTHFWAKLIACLLFFPPYIAGASRLPETIGTSWSVRVEEFFYLCWPLLLKKSKNYVRVCTIIILAVIGVRIVCLIASRFYGAHLTGQSHLVLLALERTVIDYRISCMAIGAIGAYIVVFDKKKILSFIYRKDIQWIIYSITGLLLIFNTHIPVMGFEIYSFLFCFIIVNLATNPSTVVTMNNKWISYLGRTSYGMYMYNSITRILCLEFMKMEIALYALSITTTIIASILSYELLEKPFLKLKDRFAVIKTKA
jgi:peptidoglycan/LPS O-acetylase OafA/YrhL